MSRTRIGVIHPVLERELSDWLHVVRYGPTGWRCPRCGCTKGRRLHRRVRVTQCAGCATQRSVLSGTAFACSKLSLVQILDAVRLAADVPTVSQVQASLHAARSTAWHVLQRALSGVAHIFDQSVVDPFHHHFPVPMTATGTAPLGVEAPPDVVAAQLARGTHSTTVRVDVVADRPQLGAVGAQFAGDPSRERDPEHPSVRGLRSFVQCQLPRGRRVSLRWGPRWVAALVTCWLVDSGRVPALDLGDWFRRLLAVGHRALFALGPWTRRSPLPDP